MVRECLHKDSGRPDVVYDWAHVFGGCLIACSKRIMSTESLSGRRRVIHISSYQDDLYLMSLEAQPNVVNAFFFRRLGIASKEESNVKENVP